MAGRKNIFLIGRRRTRGDEDQLTEMLAFLWQEAPEALERWLAALGLRSDVAGAEVETQFTIPSGKRPDIAILADGRCTLVESKLGSGFGDTQIADYLGFLEPRGGERALVLLTERPEAVPPEYGQRAEAAGIRLISQRWHDMSDHIAEPGEESLAGDFVQLLIREGLVKPEPFAGEDWTTWNGGFNVLLRLSALLEELDPLIRGIRPGARWKATNGLSKRWIYRCWRADALEVGLGFGAAAGDSQPHTDPIAFAFVGNKASTPEDAMAAVGVERATRYRWSNNEEMRANCGLLYEWPCLARWAHEVLTATTFEEQTEQAVAFLRETAGYFQRRGYLPGDVEDEAR